MSVFTGLVQKVKGVFVLFRYYRISVGREGEFSVFGRGAERRRLFKRKIIGQVYDRLRSPAVYRDKGFALFTLSYK